MNESLYRDAVMRKPHVLPYDHSVMDRGDLIWPCNPQLIGDHVHNVHHMITHMYRTAQAGGVCLSAVVYESESITGPSKTPVALEFLVHDGRIENIFLLSEETARGILEPLGHSEEISDLWWRRFNDEFAARMDVVTGSELWHPKFFVVANSTLGHRDEMIQRLNGERGATVKMIGRMGASVDFWVRVVKTFKRSGIVPIIVDDLEVSSLCAYPYFDDFVDYIQQELAYDPDVIDLTPTPSIPQTVGAAMASDWRVSPDTMLCALFSSFGERQVIINARRTSVPSKFVTTITLNGMFDRDHNLYLVNDCTPDAAWEDQTLAALEWGIRRMPRHPEPDPCIYVSQVRSG